MISFKMLVKSFILSYVYASEESVMVGGQRDNNNCLTGAGYTWCEDTQLCIRHWEVPCADNYDDCNDCLMKQNDGLNIACPKKCMDTDNCTLDGYIWCSTMNSCINPNKISCDSEETISEVESKVDLDTNFECPWLTCMMYCKNGYDQDENGCDTCSCSNDQVNILGDTFNSDPPRCSMLQNAVMSQCNSNCQYCNMENTGIVLGECITNEGLRAVDNLCNRGNILSCPIPYLDCNSEYVCPKVTEVTQCSDGGISGYTTYQLSLVIKNPNVKNIYAMYGDDTPVDNTMEIPPAYQGSRIFNNNIGGIAPEIIAINHDAMYDSWLTIGLTNGDPLNKIASVGIDFNSWTEDNPIHTTDGAIFITNPDEIVIAGSEYIMAQITIPTGVTENVIINVQGRLDNLESWNEYQIEFDLESPRVVNPNIIPMNCISWYDGCNTCQVRNGQMGRCTRLMCFREDNPYCLEFSSGH